ncbi:glycoside hydrolase family 31 protein [Edaphobacter bradus]|uniref:glycoside hydrolase family 31 protein n=1 Tax=Edaphobacter bradus TaxID=2259016 RepID=UPI0021E00E00|nr:TIM-barrel domain-containing protein [Edaphobacter bradus]
MRHTILALALALTFTTAAKAQTPTPDQSALTLNHIEKTSPLPNGLAVTVNGAVMQITALRPDVIRVRIGRNGRLPEDASWAVLPAARTATSAVQPDSSREAVGFHTDALRVSLDRRDGTLRVTDLAGHLLQQDLRPVEYHGSSFRLYKVMQPNEHFFGLGDKVGPLDRRNQAFTDWNTDSFGYQESTDPIYKSIPFFISFTQGRALGVLFDNTFRSSFDFGKELSNAYSFGAPDGPIDYYLFYGPTPRKVIETYAWLTGPSPLPPLWSLGFQQSRYSYYPESRVMEIANKLREEKIPADALYLDIDYQQNNRPFTVDTVKFPHFAQMIQQLAAEHFHVVAITDLHIANLPHQNYAPYDTGTAGDHFVKNPDGSVYTAAVWPGPAVFPDFTQASSRAWWGTLYTDFSKLGIAGFWNDMNEPAIFNVPTKTMPDNVQHRIDEPGFAPRTATHLEIHNIFGMENTRATYDGLLKINPNERPFVLTRASYAGGQRYAATWTGDNSSTWNHLRLTTPMLLNLGLSGFGMSGADVGGFAGTPQPDLLTKWLELGTFQPIDRDHTAKGTGDQEPWVHGIAQEAIRRRYIEERYHLMPYLYTLAEEMSRTGVPIVRPLFVEFPNATPDGHPLDLDASGEFFFGPDLLVAASPYPDELDAYELRLPPGDWYDYWTGKLAAHITTTSSRDAEQPLATANANKSEAVTQPARPLLITPSLEVLPVYVRGGSILPLQPLVQSTEETPQGPLTLRVYAPHSQNENCSGTVYQDDGISFAFRQGAYLRMDSTCKVEDGQLHIHIGAHQGSYQPWWKQLRIEVYGWRSAATAATVNGSSVSLAPDSNETAFTVDDTGSGLDIVLK